MSISNKELLKLLKLKQSKPFGDSTIKFDSVIFESLVVGTKKSEESPKIIILCGPSGSGKSTLKQLLLKQYSVTNYINIDPDDIRTTLTLNGVNFDEEDPKIMSGITNKFNSRMLEHAASNKYNIIFDTTGQNFRAVYDTILATDNYYKVFVGIYASKQNCLERVQKRNDIIQQTNNPRKLLPISIAENIYNGFTRPKGTLSNYLIDYPILVNETLLYNNDVANDIKPDLLYHKIDDDIKVSNPFMGFYNLTINATEPHITKTIQGGRKKNNKTRKKVPRYGWKNEKPTRKQRPKMLRKCRKNAFYDL